MLFAVVTCLLGSLLLGCVGYSDTSPPEAETNEPSEPPLAAAPTRRPEAGTNIVPTEDAETPQVDEMQSDAGPEQQPPIPADLRIGYTSRFDGYLMDRDGRALYMFAEDVAGAAASACLTACAKDWPPFDLQGAEPESGIIANEVTRFHRQDGRWQSAYKGHPLYYRASEAGTLEITGDAFDGRWFVARDYLAFISITMSFAPAGSEGFDSGFLTNGFGRALYVCFDDTPGEGSTPPVSSCAGDCARRRPLWSVSEASRTTILPSVMDPSDLGALLRPDGAVQLLLRGWPLYYFVGDQNAGDTQGQNQESWRAVDPVQFGKQVATQVAKKLANETAPH